MKRKFLHILALLVMTVTLFSSCKKDEDKVQKIVEFLLENESMSGKQFVACMEDREIGEAEAVSMFQTEEE